MGRIVRGVGRVVPAVVVDAREEARDIVSDARREAALILAAAADERERVRREALEEGRALAAAELTTVLAAGRAHAGELMARAVPDVLAVASKMAERIVGRAVALDASVMADIAAEALAACRTRAGAVTLRVHPDDLPAVEAHRAVLSARLGDDSALHIVADEGAGRLGCVVDTAVGRVDARLPAVLAALTASLEGADA
jgi:type III secretion protein L